MAVPQLRVLRREPVSVEQHFRLSVPGVLVLGLVLCSLLLVTLRAQSPQSPLDEAMKSITNDLTSRGNVSWTTTANGMLGAKWKTTSSLEQINADPSSCSLAWTSVEEAESEETARETHTVPLQAVLSIQVLPYSRSNPYDPEWKLEFSPETYLVGMITGKVAGRRQLFKKGRLKSDTELPNNHKASIRFLEERTATRVADEIRRAASLCGSQSPTDVAIFKITPVKCTIRFGVKASVPIEGVFDKWDSTLTFTSNHAEDAVLDVKIQAKSVDTGSGMKNEKLESKGFFDVERSPYITFNSTKVVQTGPNTFDVQGTFTIRGVSKPETLHLTLSGKGTGHGELTGTMGFDRKDYGMNSGIPFINIAGPGRGNSRPKRGPNQRTTRGLQGIVNKIEPRLPGL